MEFIKANNNNNNIMNVLKSLIIIKWQVFMTANKFDFNCDKYYLTCAEYTVGLVSNCLVCYDYVK